MKTWKQERKVWRYRKCQECGEMVALLVTHLVHSGPMCIDCFDGEFGFAPELGDLAWSGAPQAMTEYWLSP